MRSTAQLGQFLDTLLSTVAIGCAPLSTRSVHSGVSMVKFTAAQHCIVDMT
jgi:hypothetical protein